jgi:hypothetical protein
MDTLETNMVPQRLERLRKETGVSGRSQFQHLPTLDLAHSFPPDPMHTIFINLAKDVFAHWKGTRNFNNDTGSDANDYIISDVNWREIGKELHDARKTTPALWGRAPRNISESSAHYKAEEWKNWILRWSIPLLHGRLPSKYLSNWYTLVEALKTAVSLSIDEASFRKMSANIYLWVQEYER